MKTWRNSQRTPAEVGGPRPRQGEHGRSAAGQVSRQRGPRLQVRGGGDLNARQPSCPQVQQQLCGSLGARKEVESDRSDRPTAPCPGDLGTESRSEGPG